VISQGRRPGVRLAVLLILAAVLAAGSARAARRERVLMPVSVNGVARGDILAVLEDGDVLLSVEDLAAAGVRGFAGRREPAESGELVSLTSLAPDVAFSLDTETVALKLTILPRYLGTTVLDLKPGRPEGMRYTRDTSAFVNYAVHWNDFKSLDAFAEVGVSFRGNLLSSSGSRDAQGRFVRGLTSYTVDDRERLRRWVVGDAFVTAGTLGGALFLGGVGVARNFDLDPYFVRYPTLALSGAVTTPSTADIYVNGAVVRREQLPPGQFDLTNLAVPTGSGTAQIVIRDAFGGERTLASPFYASTSVLSRGLSEYAYNVGFARNPIGSRGPDYNSSLAFLGRHRVGLTDSLTPELRLEARGGLWSGGPGLAARLPFGEAEASAAWSRDHDDTGAAGSFSYRYVGQPLNFGAFARVMSARYANLGLPAAMDRARAQAGVFAGIQVGRVGLTAQYETSRMRDTSPIARISLSASLPISREANLFLSGGRARRGGTGTLEAFAGVSYSFAGGVMASLSHDRSGNGGATTSVNVQKPLPLAEGFGYQVNGSSLNSASGMARGVFQYQGDYGRYEASYEQVNGQDSKTLSASGGIVMVGGTVSATRAIGQSFALLRVPGVPGVAGFSSNQPVGRTNGRGDLLVPQILPYYGNRLSIADTDVPLDYEVAATEMNIAPPFRGGALVVFPVERVRTVVGSLLMEISGRSIVPAYGLLTLAVEKKRTEFPIGSLGDFYLENVAPGRHAVVVNYGTAACEITIEVPATERPSVNLGILRCKVDAP
jgi:outer membrane usher protein